MVYSSKKAEKYRNNPPNPFDNGGEGYYTRTATKTFQ
jgi:hypothetical protein